MYNARSASGSESTISVSSSVAEPSCNNDDLESLARELHTHYIVPEVQIGETDQTSEEDLSNWCVYNFKSNDNENNKDNEMTSTNM